MQKTFKTLLASFAILFSFNNNITAQYCFPYTTRNPDYNGYNFYIDRVRLADLDNQDSYTPADTSYNDYTLYGPKTMLTRGLAYNLTINAGPNIYYTDVYYAAWIDYNNDSDFSDAGEKLGQYKTISLNEQFNISFTVPTGASVKVTRLRIRCTWSAGPITVDPCASYTYGESEDYTVSISDFQKINTGISIGDGRPELFNMGGDNDYDLILHDEFSATVPLQFYTNNGTGTFSTISYLNTPLPDPDNDNLTFNLCDLNSDNALDVIFTYRAAAGDAPKTVYYQRSGSTLNLTSTALPNLRRGSSAAADFNNDGRQDVVICGQDNTGKAYTYVYKNTASGFILVNDKLKGTYGHLLAADYDTDGDYDIFLSGTDTYGNSNGIIYRNDGNWIFTDIRANINKTGWLDRSQFGDFNNDARPDLLIGNKIYRNDGNDNFTEIKTDYIDGIDPGDGHWSDINNDGILELISKEYDGITIFKFNSVDSFLIDQRLLVKGTIDIGDINGDNKQDIFTTGYYGTFNLRNMTSATNTPPSPPINTSASIGDSGFYSVSLRWSAGPDDKTPAKGLSYNLRVGSSSGGNNIYSSMTSTTNSSLLKPGMGNVCSDTTWFLRDLAPGTYYWSVQAVDNSGLASAFSTQKTFTILAPLTQSSFTVPGRIISTAAGADIDGDMDIDLIIKDTDPKIYQQTAPYTYTSKTIKTNTEIIGIKDLNNDNLPDLIARHNKIFGVETYDSLSLLINKGNFEFKIINIDTLSLSNVAAADFDNDGDIDILTYNKGYYFYENTDSLQYTRTKLPMEEIMYRTSISTVDLDRDQDNDFLISGRESNGSTGNCYTMVYKNMGNNNFVLSQNIVPGIGSSRFMATGFFQINDPADITWNDYNFDGYPDLLITGDDEFGNNTNQIFLNDGTGLLTGTSLSPRPADKYSSTWIDINTDGFLDLILPKAGFIVDNIIYLNDNNSGYTGFANAIDDLTLLAFMKAIDVDNDKDKDIVCTFKIPAGDAFVTETKIYTNNNNFVNQAPNPPTSISSEIDSFTVILNWNNGWDKLTGYNGHSYNIRIGTANDKADIVSPMADLTTGFRFVENIGNVGTNTSWKLENLPLGTYYWSVQTIDNSFTGSTWAPVQSFTLSALTANFETDTVCLGFDTHLTDISVTTSPIISWKWYFGGGLTSSAQNPVFRFTKAGNNPVKLVVESAVAKDSIIRNVYVKPVPVTAFTSNTVCAGSPTTLLNATNTNGLTISEWHWDFGDNSGSNVQDPGTHGYLIAGTYTAILVAVADNGCSDTIRKSIDVGMIPTAAITLSGPPNFCSGDSLKLVNSYTDTYAYTWQTGGVDITGAAINTYTAKQTGSYTVKVINPTGSCTSVSSAVNVTVKESPLQPAISYSGETEFCAGDSLLLSVSQTDGLVYKWKLNGGSVGSDSNQYPAIIGGNYYLVVTNSDGCSSGSTNSVEVKVNNRPAATSLSPPSKPELCEGETIVLGVTSFPGYAYQWLNDNVPLSGATDNTYRVTESGKYQLEVSNVSGCSIKTNSVNINVNTRPVKPIIDAPGYTQGMCLGETPLKISIDAAIPSYTYQWYKNGATIGNSTFIEDFFEDGSYYVEADLNGCKRASDSIIMDFREALPKPDIIAKGPIVWYLSTGSDAEFYKWYFNDNLISGAGNKTYIAGQNLGIYRVSISNDGTCFRISDASTIPAGIVGIEDIDPFEGVKIYPNPTTGMFTIEMDNNIFGELIIDIYTQNGSKALNIKFEKTTEHFSSQIDLSGQSKGMYLINLSIDKFKGVRKILVE